MFKDRTDAANQLLERLPDYAPGEAVVLALPRGGVPLGEIIARGKGLPLDIILVRKVGAPGHRELAVGAVTDGPDPAVTVNKDVARSLGLRPEDVEALAERELPEIARRRRAWLGGRAAIDLDGKTAIVVDDGIATGATMRAALRLVRASGAARVVLAVPVAPADTLAALRPEADEVICLATPEPFMAVGAHYRRFDQVADDTVARILSEMPPPGAG